LCSSRSASSAANCSTRFVSALKGISTDVETFLAEDRPALDFLPDVFEGQVGASEDTAGQPFALANQTEQQMLGLDRDGPELAGLVSGEEQNATRSFSVAFEHPF
jgi:hypothetical protein